VRRCLPTPTIDHDLRLWICGEQLGVVELIPESAIERFGGSVFSQGDPGAM